MSSPEWAIDTTIPRREGPRGTETYQGPGLDRFVRDSIASHDASNTAHAYIRSLLYSALASAGISQRVDGTWAYVPPNIVEATADTKGVARILAGTADFPRVPWNAVTGRPTIPTTFSELTGIVPQASLPAVALVDYLGVVNSQAAMLALTGQRGDWCTRSDQNMDYQLIADTPSLIASWRAMTYPAAPVSSVNGRTGAVTGLAEQSSLNGKVDTTTTIYALPQDANLYAAATATTAALTTTATAVSGASVSITSPGTSARWRVDAIFDISCSVASAVLAQGRLAVDGNAQTALAVFAAPTAGMRATVAQQWYVTGLSAGSHTLALQGILSATGAGTYVINSGNTTISVARVS